MTYDFNTGRGKRDVFSNAVNAVVDAAIEAAGALEPPREYLGASQIGDPCARRIQYELMGTPCDPFTARTRRIFARGHNTEAMVANWLRLAGFELTTQTKSGGQHGFAVADDQFKGHIDGVLLSGPEIEGLTYPALWENKALGAKGYKAVAKDGVVKAYPNYADQVALYQAYLELPNACLFSTVNSDTMEIFYEAVDLDEVRAQAASDKAVLVLRSTKAGILLPRVSTSPEMFPCTFCRHAKHCWSET